MSRRTLIAITEAQMHWLETAIRSYVEGGAGWDDASEKLIGRHFDNIERQMRKEYTSTERTAIYEEAVRIAAFPSKGEGE